MVHVLRKRKRSQPESNLNIRNSDTSNVQDDTPDKGHTSKDTEFEVNVNPRHKKCARITSATTNQMRNNQGCALSALCNARNPGSKSATNARAYEVLESGDGSVSLRQFEFLQLPSELRNQVYHHVLEDAKKKPNDRTLRKPRQETNIGEDVWDPQGEGVEANDVGSKEKYASDTTEDAIPARFPSRYHGLTRTCRQIWKEFEPLLFAVQPPVINIDEALDYLNAFHPPAKLTLPDVHAGCFRLNTRFQSTASIDVLPLLHILDQSPELHVSFVHVKINLGSQKPSTAYYPGIEELFNTYADWQDLEVLLDLQRLLLRTLYRTSTGSVPKWPTFSITPVVSPNTSNMFFKTGKLYNTPVYSKYLEWMTSLLYRSDLPDFPRRTGLTIKCNFGLDIVTWSFGRMKGVMSVLVEPYKGTSTVLIKPRSWVLKVRSEDTDEGWQWTSSKQL